MPMRPMTNEEFLYWMQTGMLPPSYVAQPAQQPVPQEPAPQPNPLFQQIRQGNWQEGAAAKAAQEAQQERAATAQGIGAGISAVGNYMMATGNPVGAIVSGIGGLFSALGGK